VKTFQALIAESLQHNVKSLKTGMRGWSDYEQDMVDAEGTAVDADTAIDYFTPNLRPEQLSKKAGAGEKNT